ncbi:AbrB family transcriptional regulator [Marinivivus vitaminiproducens]|uniref:AbrB family transcriptional regulator n=1 Tax=Marinivivus vitaminiproducens TaxID=3035935 RepID=UPI00279A6FA8|nr:AbrB family transcriptional regulator [Geminicoccaceae bacterium SCSIO 64248]
MSIRSLAARIWAYVPTLLLGAAGGFVFAWFKLPLPWMLGPLAVGLVGSFAGLSLRGPKQIAAPMRTVLGVLLGASFTPAMAAQAVDLAASLVLLIPYIALSAALGIVYLKTIAGYDTATAYFAAMPGGLNDMVLFAEEQGADHRKVSLMHGTRILLIVFFVPFYIQLSSHVVIDRSVAGWVGLADLSWGEVALLLGCAILGFPLGRLLRLPGAALMGPMLLSAILHISGLSGAKPPDLLVILAQITLGTLIGARYAGVPRREIVHTIVLSVGLVVILLAVTFLFTWLVPILLGYSRTGVLLAFSPGGLAETSLIALALGVEVAYVACHHVCRVVMVIAFAPVVFRLTAGRSRTVAPFHRPDPDD